MFYGESLPLGSRERPNVVDFINRKITHDIRQHTRVLEKLTNTIDDEAVNFPALNMNGGSPETPVNSPSNLVSSLNKVTNWRSQGLQFPEDAKFETHDGLRYYIDPSSLQHIRRVVLGSNGVHMWTGCLWGEENNGGIHLELVDGNPKVISPQFRSLTLTTKKRGEKIAHSLVLNYENVDIEVDLSCRINKGKIPKNGKERRKRISCIGLYGLQKSKLRHRAE